MRDLDEQQSTPIPYYGGEENSLERVRQRQKVVNLEMSMKDEIASGAGSNFGGTGDKGTCYFYWED